MMINHMAVGTLGYFISLAGALTLGISELEPHLDSELDGISGCFGAQVVPKSTAPGRALPGFTIHGPSMAA